MNPKLYQILSEKQIRNFLKDNNSTLENEKIIEIKEKDLFGDFICNSGYKFKITFGKYQCLETPKEKHITEKINIIKCKTDSLNYKKEGL